MTRLLPLALLGAGLVACRTGDPTAAASAPRLQGPIEAADFPASGPFPRPPGIERPGDETPVDGEVLAKDTVSVGRIVGEGRRARYAFESAVNELSLFELMTVGYSRGWTSTARMVIRAADGTELARSERSGGTVYQDVLPFVAPRAGTYTLEVVAAANDFRYRIVRHASFRAGVGATVQRVGERTTVHGWLGERENVRVFRVTGAPGERVQLVVEPTDERGRGIRRQVRRQATAALAGFGALTDSMRGHSDVASFPRLALEVDEAARVAGRGHAATVRIPGSGSLDVRVTWTEAGPPVLFDLDVERGLAFVPVPIRVGDGDDDPVAGAEVALLREPGVDPLGGGTTSEEGALVLDLPPGDYTVLYRRPGGSVQSVRTRISAGTEINLALD